MTPGPPERSRKFETRSRGLAASRFDAELALAATDTGLDRYATMTQMRSQEGGGVRQRGGWFGEDSKSGLERKMGRLV